jgi:hypothetical protein
MELTRLLEETLHKVGYTDQTKIQKLHVLHLDQLSISLRIWEKGALRPISIKAFLQGEEILIQQLD